MLNIQKKDITSVEDGYIFHQVNCQNSMGSGVAKALYEKWPSVKLEYHKFFNGGKTPDDVFGKVQVVKISPSLTVFNSFSQLNYGNSYRDGNVYTNMEILKRNLSLSAEKALRGNKKIYIPEFLGCGLAGGNWSDLVHFLQEKNFKNLIVCSIS